MCTAYCVRVMCPSCKIQTCLELSLMPTKYTSQFYMETVSQLTEYHDITTPRYIRSKAPSLTIAIRLLLKESDSTTLYVLSMFLMSSWNRSIIPMTQARICLKIMLRHVILLAKEMKVSNKMFGSGSKTTVIKFRDKKIALNETTDLYGTLMILTKPTWDIDKKNAISNHEFTLTPR